MINDIANSLTDAENEMSMMMMMPVWSSYFGVVLS